MNCTRCSGSGFINIEHLPESILDLEIYQIEAWIAIDENESGDCGIFDCCGDGDGWYGEPGRHYTSSDPVGKNGPYAYNGGLCECH